MLGLLEGEKYIYSFRHNTRTRWTDGRTDTARRHKPRYA